MLTQLIANDELYGGVLLNNPIYAEMVQIKAA